ncbi:MAG: LysE family translocator [Pseudomonadota bacterium]
MDPSIWIAYLAASTALLLIPGPTVMLVLAYALGQGRRVAVPTAFGVAAGDLAAMSASLLGLGVLVATSAAAFVLLKWAGAVYLIYLGVRMIRSAGGATPSSPDAPGAAMSRRSAFMNAATVTALNPKSIAFFIAFVPQFIDPARAFAPQAAILIGTFVGLAMINALAYAMIADRMRLAIRRPAVLRWLTRIGGTTLIGMGIATAMLRRSAA